MSAFVVENKTINSVLACLAMYRRYGDYVFHRLIQEQLGLNLESAEDRQKLGEAMFKLNCSAVDQRYGEGEAAQFRELNYQYCSLMPPALIQAYKALACWSYQCCEGDVPESSLLYAAMGRVSDRMAHEIVQSSKAYETGGWA